MFGWLRKQGPISAPRAIDDDAFDEEFQRRLEALAIASRRLVSGRMRAERRSQKTGAGIEFADHREYAPGDDFRHLDWKLYGRSEKLLLKLFQEEEDLSVYLLLDTSGSMQFGAPQKLAYGKRIAAALAYVALSTLDRVSVLTFADVIGARLPPTRGKSRIFKVFEFLRGTRPEGRTGIEGAMRAFAAQHKRRGVAIVISDLYDPAGFERGIDALRYARFEPFVIQLVDPTEARPPLHGDVRLVDRETGESREVTVTPRVLERYAAAHAAYLAGIASYCAQKQVPHVVIETSTAWDDAVLSVLRRGGLLG
ncbi:DUF58 domain-containing protein [Sandaracinus amylolyticus]|uniref:VWFA domain-containing protein n=1 Tax=Sandaracinus amylolyticus TaxID=927083 RepID=A0A0F6YI37_9BACT|nr:DUF58 domain-containing protein [Sandaracinus amylolyticus]AKF06303.1 hypothetical protein DB32_003452 [Sandaracinus amylolyticus]